MRLTHGERRPLTPEYRAWRNARNRCLNPRSARFKDWGGRGIKFLFNSYKEFLADVGRRPSPKHMLDRIDNDGHYEPGNMRWTTASESGKNRRMTPKRLRYLRRHMREAQKIRWAIKR